MHTWNPSGTNAETKARNILSAAMWLHVTFRERVWVWRGQASGAYGVEPGMHTRVRMSKHPHDERTVVRATARLTREARRLQLDTQHDIRLPDLPLLASLQHHGAATPLLDVSTDPLIALWMIAFADAKNPAERDSEAGSLFGIAKPPRERWISPLDARSYAQVSGAIGNAVWWYQAPDVTERLRIQRGSFLIGALTRPAASTDTTLSLELALDEENFIERRLARRGNRGNGHLGRVEMFRINVPGASKPHLRRLLEERSGLAIETIYPTPWHQPFIAQFASAYDRKRDLALDLP